MCIGTGSSKKNRIGFTIIAIIAILFAVYIAVTR